MKKYNDTDLREALRRLEAGRPPTEVPADFLAGVMQDIECQKRPRRTRHIALAAIAAAASIALFMVLTTEPQQATDTTSGNTAQYPGARDTLMKKQLVKTVSLPTAHSESASIPDKADSRPTQGGFPVQARRTENEPTTSNDEYLAQLESDLADVRDSCYLAQVERMIADNEELQQLMNELTNHKQ